VILKKFVIPKLLVLLFVPKTWFVLVVLLATVPIHLILALVLLLVVMVISLVSVVKLTFNPVLERLVPLVLLAPFLKVKPSVFLLKLNLVKTTVVNLLPTLLVVIVTNLVFNLVIVVMIMNNSVLFLKVNPSTKELPAGFGESLVLSLPSLLLLLLPLRFG